MRCFYDAEEQVDLWGKYLAEELPVIYGELAAAVVVFVSAEYAARDWTRLERRSALNRAVRERQEYVLPARFDDTPLPGPLSDMVAIDLRIRTPQEFAEMIAAKLAALGIVVSMPPTAASLDEDLRSPKAAAPIRTLPRDSLSFTGRQHELQELADAAAGSGGVVGIHAIGGMAGVGKTAFAVHAAHRLADRFPAGQIFLPLHGHTPGQQPVAPADALASLLLTLGVPPAQIPPGLEARMALWRDQLANRRLLLVLDDAASSEQGRPLLPGSGGSLVLVTSRRHLSALEDATAISLDTFPPGEAAALLVRLAGRAGLGPADPPVGKITRLCGCLPLAIGMVGRQLHHHPA
jgi:hypothetical protein